MDYQKRLELSYYKEIAPINESHKVYLVQHIQTGKIYVKKILDIFNANIYRHLMRNPVMGTPKVFFLYEEEKTLTVIEEFISGQSLEEIIASNNFTSEDIIRYMTNLTEIVEKLHMTTPPIIHRDIKPSNIMITSYEKVVLLDFNAAKSFSAKEEDTILLGTQGYAAPEQYGFGSSSPLTDIYPIGVILKEMTILIPNTDPYFKRLCKIGNKCTQIDPSDRYRSATELLRALQALSAPEKVAKDSIEQSFLPPGFRSGKIHKILLATIGYLALISMAITLKAENTTGAYLWYYRAAFLFSFLSAAFAGGNYRGIHRLIPWCKSNQILKKILGITLLTVLAFFTVFLFFIILGSILFPE